MKTNKFTALPILALLALMLAVPLAAQNPSPYNTPSPDDPNRMNPISAPKDAAPPADQPVDKVDPSTSTTTTTTTTTNDPATNESTTATETTTQDSSLPQTASPLALLALLAAGGATSAFGLRKARRH